ncbi:helix-turn-helix domain-containing protein [Streptomyces sp. 2A115]|uniref:helix-turn-helix domain-containing protein n=1 Tax=Streptomyces sp. 2A115 TaxID=3457439 RepID=UPI003FCFB638
MDASGWPEENWVVLGEEIAKARRAKGWDQPELARQSGNSPNTISNYERGRVPRSRRVPPGVTRVAQALGWLPDTANRILAGEDPEVALGQPELFSLPERYEEMSRSRRAGTASAAAGPARVGPLSARDIELTQSGHVAQDTFIRQMKRYRKLQNVSTEELAKRVAEFGGDISLENLTRLENGTRQLNMWEAETLARALDTSVQWLLGSGFQSGMPDELTAPPTDEELQAEAKAIERRIAEAGIQVNHAAARHAYVVEQAEQARREAEMARMMVQQAITQQAELERQYHYLLGRIDSLRAAKGEELIIQTHLVSQPSDEDFADQRSVGAQLAEGRKRLEMTLEDTHLLTRIRPDIILAIERDDFTAVSKDPGKRDVFARGHIRVLARAYGLDPAQLLSQYDAERGGWPAPSPEAPVSPADSGTKPRRRVVRRKKTDGDQ